MPDERSVSSHDSASATGSNAGAPHMTPEQFREIGHRVVDWVAGYMEGVGTLDVKPRVEPGSIRAALAESYPEHGAGLDAWDGILADLENVIVPGLTHWQHPGFFAYFPCNASGPSVLAELVSAGLNVNGMLWSTSPAATELETHVLDWCVDLFGLPQHFKSDSERGGGVIQGTASEATLIAILAAKHRMRKAHGLDRSACVFASEHAHSSVAKAAMIAGIANGPDDSTHIRLVPADARGRMDLGKLRAMLTRAVEACSRSDEAPLPVCVVASVGTTSSGSVDDVASIAEIAREVVPNAWVHVDAAWAGVAAVCPEHRGLFNGIDLVDSVCFNLHKWGLTNFDCDLFYMKDREAVISTLSITPEYLRNEATESGRVIDYRDWQIPLGRRFRALKVWFMLRHYGADGLRAHIREGVALAQHLGDRIGADSRFEIPIPRSLGLLCFRMKGGTNGAADTRTDALLKRLNDTGRVYLSHTRLPLFDDQNSQTGESMYVIRVSIGTTSTRPEHVEELWTLIDRSADEVLAGAGG